MRGQSIGYAAGRRYAIVDSLEKLGGPTSRTINLPRRLDWGPPRVFDFDDLADVAVMYETVLREGRSAEDLCAYLDGALLRSLWPALVLPAQVRALWESRFPRLRQAAAA